MAQPVVVNMITLPEQDYLEIKEMLRHLLESQPRQTSPRKHAAFMSLKEIEEFTGIPESTWYKGMKAGYYSQPCRGKERNKLWDTETIYSLSKKLSQQEVPEPEPRKKEGAAKCRMKKSS